MHPTSAVFVWTVVTGVLVCRIDRTAALSGLQPPANVLVANSTFTVPNTTITTVSSATSVLAKRSDTDDDEEGETKSLFRSFIPISPFKKPIKTIFRSWFEPNPDALREESTSSSFYFIRPQKKPSAGPSLFKNKRPDATLPHLYRTYPAKQTNRQSSGRSQYSYHSSQGLSSHQPSSAPSHIQKSSPTFAIGDPENGRGITLSLGDGPQQSNAQYGLATNQYYQNAASSQVPEESAPDGGGSGGGGGGLSFSLGGRGGGSGLSFNLGGRGGSRGNGMSISLGGGGGGGGGGGEGGSGMRLNLGGGGSSIDSSSSSNYPSYSSNYGSNSYGSYGQNYGSNNYGSYSNNYYPPKPRFSITMPSPGKTVVEANMRPPILKMKLNASPKVKITTGTRDPLEKNHDEEVIREDIFGPPAPFEKPMKNMTDNSTMHGAFNQTYPYPYPYPYPGYYAYPYNYYYNYYQQYYPQAYANAYQSKSPYGYNYGQYPYQNNSSYSRPSTLYKHRPVELAAAASQTKWQQARPIASFPRTYTRPASTINSGSLLPAKSYASEGYSFRPSVASEHRSAHPYETHSPSKVQFMDHNSVSYKRSSASSNYNKDMLTLGSNSIMSYAKPDYGHSPKKQQYSGQESKNYYQYESVPKQSAGPNALATSQYPYYAQPGTGLGYSFYNSSSPYNSSSYYSNPYYSHPYYNPYYYNYYYNYAKQYYDHYYGNYSNNGNSSHGNSSYGYKKPRKSISGFNQESFDHHQSKIFGSKTEKYPGGSTKEEKSRIIMDIRPRVTFRMLNRTQAEEEHLKQQKKKDKEHIFRTRLTMLMETTTAKPLYEHNYYNKYYGEEVDEFGYTKAPHVHEAATTVRPKTTTTRRRTTTTEEPSSSSEGSEEDNTSQEEDSSSTTTSTTEAPADTDETSAEEVEDEKSKEQTTTSTTSTTEAPAESSKDDEVIEASDETNKDDTTSNKGTEDEETEDKSEEKVEEKVEEKTEDKSAEKLERQRNVAKESSTEKPIPIPAHPITSNGNVTVSPELVAAMIKALQDALGVTPVPNGGSQAATTPSPGPVTTLTSLEAETDEEGSEEEDTDNANGESSETADEQNEQEETSPTTSTSTTTPAPKRSKLKGAKDLMASKSKLIPTVYSTVVTNTTQLRLKTPVLNMRSAARAAAKKRTSSGAAKLKESGSKLSQTEVTNEFTTTSPFIIVNKGSRNKANEVSKVIDGNAVLSNFNVDDLTDEERRSMLTNILGAIQSKNSANNEIESQAAATAMPAKSGLTSRRKSKESPTKLMLPVTKATNVRIVSSMDELTEQNKSADNNSPNSPIYVVLLPQSKKKK